jgi:4-hydroxyacetophenone monooxygenase
MMSFLVAGDVPEEYVPMMLESGRTEIECKRSVHDAYDERLQQALAGMLWSHPSIQSSWYKNSWYKNRARRVTVLSRWRLVDYWSWTRRPDLDDFELA